PRCPACPGAPCESGQRAFRRMPWSGRGGSRTRRARSVDETKQCPEDRVLYECRRELDRDPAPDRGDRVLSCLAEYDVRCEESADEPRETDRLAQRALAVRVDRIEPPEDETLDQHRRDTQRDEGLGAHDRNGREVVGVDPEVRGALDGKRRD